MSEVPPENARAVFRHADDVDVAFHGGGDRSGGVMECASAVVFMIAFCSVEAYEDAQNLAIPERKWYT